MLLKGSASLFKQFHFLIHRLTNHHVFQAWHYMDYVISGTNDVIDEVLSYFPCMSLVA